MAPNDNGHFQISTGLTGLLIIIEEMLPRMHTDTKLSASLKLHAVITEIMDTVIRILNRNDCRRNVPSCISAVILHHG